MKTPSLPTLSEEYFLNLCSIVTLELSQQVKTEQKPPQVERRRSLLLLLIAWDSQCEWAVKVGVFEPLIQFLNKPYSLFPFLSLLAGSGIFPFFFTSSCKMPACPRAAMSAAVSQQRKKTRPGFVLCEGPHDPTHQTTPPPKTLQPTDLRTDSISPKRVM